MTKSLFSVQLDRFDAQTNLLRNAESDAHVADVLDLVGLTIDDLVYENSRTVQWRGTKPPDLSSFAEVGDGIPLVSFFTGCGGLDLGFEAVGFKHLAAFEHNEIFCKTLRINRPDWKVFGPPLHSGDICEYGEVADVLLSIVEMPFDGVFIGGPPCQPFSIAANQRFSKSGDNFKRVGFDHTENGNLLLDFVNYISAFAPMAFVIENVPGLRDLDGGRQLASVIRRLERIGYTVVTPDVYDAAEYGVPQFRQRMFIIGARKAGEFRKPERREHIGAGSVLSSLPGIESFNHETRKHRVGSVLRYSWLDYGKREQLGRVDRLDPTQPSKTVIAGGTNGGGRSHLHPEIPRTLTVRECARLQTFADDYEFFGPVARQFTQVGNAVPPVLAASIATQVATAFF